MNGNICLLNKYRHLIIELLWWTVLHVHVQQAVCIQYIIIILTIHNPITKG